MAEPLLINLADNAKCNCGVSLVALCHFIVIYQHFVNILTICQQDIDICVIFCKGLGHGKSFHCWPTVTELK